MTLRVVLKKVYRYYYFFYFTTFKITNIFRNNHLIFCIVFQITAVEFRFGYAFATFHRCKNLTICCVLKNYRHFNPVHGLQLQDFFCNEFSIILLFFFVFNLIILTMDNFGCEISDTIMGSLSVIQENSRRQPLSCIPNIITSLINQLFIFNPSCSPSNQKSL
jgi:hypothetical protein